VGKTSHFLALNVNIENGKIRPKLLLMTNRKSHMRFRLSPRWLTKVTFNCYKYKFSENFAEFCWSVRQQQLNEWK